MRRPSINQIAIVLLLLAAANALLFWLRTLGQPLIDAQSFRQTQTALTALWIEPDPIRLLNYQTPVLGAPWSVPFEFPLYQLIVAALAGLLRLDLSFCGRLVSLVFGLGAMAVAIALLRDFGFSRLTKLLFASLYLASSIYLYWNRAFLIESTALFFTLTALLFYTRTIRSPDDLALPRRLLQTFGFALSLSLALLVKATTAAPVVILLACHMVWRLLRLPIELARASRGNGRSWRSTAALSTSLALLAGLAIAFLILRQWTHHADALKALNPYGLRLTSTALHGWNYGSLQQRFSRELWKGVLIERMLNKRAWLPLILLLVAGTWQLRKDRIRLRFVLICIALGLLPLLLFPNLHIIHDYYQTANQLFLLLAIAAAAAAMLEQPLQPGWTRLLAAAILLFYLALDSKRFDTIYRSQALQRTDEKFEISRIIDQSVESNAAVLVIGDDWYSSFPYLSRRRALVLPTWYDSGPYSEAGVLSDPRPRLKPYRLGAIVSERPLAPRSLATICPAFRRVPPVDAGRWILYLCSTGAQNGLSASDADSRT